jgi:hypothetical protein
MVDIFHDVSWHDSIAYRPEKHDAFSRYVGRLQDT